MSNFFSKFYLKSEIPAGVVSLYSNRLIKELATGLLGLFLPIFLFQVYGSINTLLIFYGLSYLIYLIFTAPGAMLATKFTFNKAMVVSVLFGILVFISLFFLEKNILLFSALIIIFSTFERILYWVPFHSGMAKFIDHKNRGKILSLLSSGGLFLRIVLPILAGFIIVQYGFGVLFIMAILIYFSSLIPLISTPPIGEFYTFGYWQTWKILFHPRDRRILITYMADGAIDFVNKMIWPIFIWQLLEGNYEIVGLVSSLIVLVTILLKLIMGNFTDKFDKKKLLRYGTILYSIGWLFKIFVETAFQILMVSTYHTFSAVAMRTPFDTLMYEKAADAGHYIDEYTVLREMSLNIGRVVMVLILLAILSLFGGVTIAIAFALAAIAALFINMI